MSDMIKRLEDHDAGRSRAGLEVDLSRRPAEDD